MIISLPDTFENQMRLQKINIPPRDTEEWNKLYYDFMDTLHKINQQGEINVDGFIKRSE